MSQAGEIANAMLALIDDIPAGLRPPLQIQSAGYCETIRAEINDPYVKRALRALGPFGAARAK